MTEGRPLWDRVEDRLALLELLTAARLKRRHAQQAAFAWLVELAWTRASGRRDELTLVPEHRAAVVQLLDRVWTDWRDEHLALLEAGEPPTPSGWSRLADRRRAAALPLLPEQLNRRTASAATAPGAKVSLTATRREALGAAAITGDGIVRLRAPAGLVARRGDLALALDAVEAALGEVALAERALQSGLALEGAVTAVVLVENLGAWRDMPRPEGFLLVHVPGWETATVRALFQLELLAGVPALHFGDLDPNGLRIHRHLAQHIPGLRWFVPPCWRDLLPLHTHRRTWPDDIDLSDAPPFVRELASTHRWLEQEPLALHPDLPAALVAEAMASLTARPPRVPSEPRP